MRKAIYAALCSSLATGTSIAQDYNINEEQIIGTVVIGGNARGVETTAVAPQTVISSQEIDMRQATTLGQLMDTIPNVKLVNGITPQGAGVQMRGLGSQPSLYGLDGKVTVTVDGVTSAAEEIYRNGSLLSVEPELFDRLSVTRGPSKGFRFQGGAVAGTIELQTKNGSSFIENEETFAFRQKLAQDSLGKAWNASSILAIAPTSEVDALLFFGRRVSEDRKDGNGQILSNTAFDQTAMMAKFNYFVNANKMTLSYVNNEVPENDTPYDVYLPSVGALFGNVDRLTKDQTSYFEYNFNPIDKDILNVTLRISRKHEELRLNSISGNSSTLLEANHLTTTNSFRIENAADIFTGSVGHSFLLGFEYAQRNRSSIDATGSNNSSAPGGMDLSFSLYAMDDIEIGSRLLLSPQLRYEEQVLVSQNNGSATTDFGNGTIVTNPAIPDGANFLLASTTGALGFKYRITDAFNGFGSLAYNENLPLLDDLRGLEDGSFDNKAEKSRTYEAGLSYDAQSVFSLRDELQARLSAYKNNIWDVHTYSGINDIDLEGSEVEITYTKNDWFVDFNAAKSRGKVNSSSAPFNFATGDSLQISVGTNLRNDTLNPTFEIYHAPAFNRTSATSGALAPSKPYTLCNLRVGYLPNSGPLKGFEVRAAVENIANVTYRAYGNERNGPGQNIKLTIGKTF